MAAQSQAPLVLAIDAGVCGPAIPNDFVGLSFETSNLLPDTNGHHLFSPENRQLVNLFRNIGIRNLRIGGGTVDIPRYAVPGPADIDQLFAFAKATDVKVIYSFRLLNGNKTNAAALAKYIWQNYRSQLDAFSIGNEPDWKSYHNKDANIKDYPSFLSQWREFAKAILAAVPQAKFAGPDTGSDYPVPSAIDTRFDGESWTQRFAEDEKSSGIMAAILQHDYVGQSAKGVGAQAAVDAMLSSDWDTVNYPALYEGVLAHVASTGLPYRMTECNDYTGGVKDVSNAFVSALWALDYMHWWAAHDCSGVNFHNKRWIFTDTIYEESDGNFWINPKAYALKAFGLGGHGNVLTSVRLTNPTHANVDCYAVSDSTSLFVTIINKTHDSSETNACITIRPGHFKISTSECMTLESATPGDCLAMEAKPLGGSPINSTEPWHGQWAPLPVGAGNECVLTVEPASAVVVRLSQQQRSEHGTSN